MSIWSAIGDIAGDMSFGDWMKLIETGYGIWDERDGELNMREVYANARPDTHTPWWDQTTDWSTGKPVITRSPTAEYQPVVDMIMDAMLNPPDPYKIPNDQLEMQNARTNYQRSRYGLDPIDFTPRDPSTNTEGSNTREENNPPQGDPDITEEEQRELDQREIDDTMEDVFDPPNNDDIDNGTDIIRDINDAIDRRDRINDPYNGRAGGRGGGDDIGIPGENLQWDLGMSPVEFLKTFQDTHNASEVDKLFGRLDIPSNNGVWALEEGVGLGGKILSFITGIPGLGWLGDKVGQHYLSQKELQSPVAGSDPYAPNPITDIENEWLAEFLENPEGLDRSTYRDLIETRGGYGQDYKFENPNAWGGLPPPDPNYTADPTNSPYLDNPDARGDINPTDGYNNQVQPEMGYGQGGGYDNRSITGGGDYGYATRLRGRGGGGGMKYNAATGKWELDV